MLTCPAPGCERTFRHHLHVGRHVHAYHPTFNGSLRRIAASLPGAESAPCAPAGQRRGAPDDVGHRESPSGGQSARRGGPGTRQTLSETRSKRHKTLSRTNENTNATRDKSSDETSSSNIHPDPDQDDFVQPHPVRVTRNDDESDDVTDATPTLGRAADDADPPLLPDWFAADDEDVSDVSDDEEDLSTLFVESLRPRAMASFSPIVRYGDVGDTLCGRVLYHYESMGEHARSRAVFSSRGAISASPLFDTAALRKGFAYACAAGGAGLSRIDVY